MEILPDLRNNVAKKLMVGFNDFNTCSIVVFISKLYTSINKETYA